MTQPSDPDQLLEQFMLPERLERIDSVLNGRTRSLTVVLDQVHNYHNISAVIRSADAFGVSDIHLVGSEFEYSRSISLGTERWMDLIRHDTAEDAVEALRKKGYSLVILQPEEHNSEKSLPPAMPITALPFEKQLALVFGNERDGVSKPLIDAAQIHAYIPMKGFVESLNISVACAICLFCSTISPGEPMQRTQPLDNAEKQEIRSRWLKKGVRNSERILREVQARFR